MTIEQQKLKQHIEVWSNQIDDYNEAITAIAKISLLLSDRYNSYCKVLKDFEHVNNGWISVPKNRCYAIKDELENILEVVDTMMNGTLEDK